jgi:hypothetical protein
VLGRTRIAFDRLGEGPPLILVEAAGHYRDPGELHGVPDETLAPVMMEFFQG